MYEQVSNEMSKCVLQGEGMCSVQIPGLTRNKSLSLCPIQAKAYALLRLVEEEILDS